MSIPPKGTMCSDCQCCEARIYYAGEPLCASCAAGNPLCMKARLAGMVEMGAAPVEGEAQTESHSAASEEEPEMPGTRIVTPEVKAAILAEALTVSNYDVAAKFGVSHSFVSKLRTKAGKHSAIRPGHYRRTGIRDAVAADLKGTTPQKQEGEVKTGKLSNDELKLRILAEPPEVRTNAIARKYGISWATAKMYRDGGEPKRATPERSLGDHLREKGMEPRTVSASRQTTLVGEETATVTLKLTPGQMDSIWERLTMSTKATAIAAALQAQA